MLTACEYARSMSKHIQIKNVEDALHRKLKIRAVESGLSLSEYLKRELASLATRPTNAELLARLKKLKPVKLSKSPAQLVREDRDSR